MKTYIATLILGCVGTIWCQSIISRARSPDMGVSNILKQTDNLMLQISNIESNASPGGNPTANIPRATDPLPNTVPHDQSNPASQETHGRHDNNNRHRLRNRQCQQTHVDIPNQHGNTNAFPVIHRVNDPNCLQETHGNMPNQHDQGHGQETHVDIPSQHNQGHGQETHGRHDNNNRHRPRNRQCQQTHVDMTNQHGNTNAFPVIHRVNDPNCLQETHGNMPNQHDQGHGQETHVDLPSQHNQGHGQETHGRHDNNNRHRPRNRQCQQTHVDMTNQHGNTNAFPVIHRVNDPNCLQETSPSVNDKGPSNVNIQRGIFGGSVVHRDQSEPPVNVDTYVNLAIQPNRHIPSSSALVGSNLAGSSPVSGLVPSDGISNQGNTDGNIASAIAPDVPPPDVLRDIMNSRISNVPRSDGINNQGNIDNIASRTAPDVLPPGAQTDIMGSRINNVPISAGTSHQGITDDNLASVMAPDVPPPDVLRDMMNSRSSNVPRSDGMRNQGNIDNNLASVMAPDVPPPDVLRDIMGSRINNVPISAGTSHQGITDDNLASAMAPDVPPPDVLRDMMGSRINNVPDTQSTGEHPGTPHVPVPGNGRRHVPDNTHNIEIIPSSEPQPTVIGYPTEHVERIGVPPGTLNVPVPTRRRPRGNRNNRGIIPMIDGPQSNIISDIMRNVHANIPGMPGPPPGLHTGLVGIGPGSGHPFPGPIRPIIGMHGPMEAFLSPGGRRGRRGRRRWMGGRRGGRRGRNGRRGRGRRGWRGGRGHTDTTGYHGPERNGNDRQRGPEFPGDVGRQNRGGGGGGGLLGSLMRAAVQSVTGNHRHGARRPAGIADSILGLALGK